MKSGDWVMVWIQFQKNMSTKELEQKQVFFLMPSATIKKHENLIVLNGNVHLHH